MRPKMLMYVVIAAALFASGIAVGQRAATSKFDKCGLDLRFPAVSGRPFNPKNYLRLQGKPTTSMGVDFARL